METMNELEDVKNQKWFYEFNLPDGSITESYLPQVARQVHATRQKALRHYLRGWGSDGATAFDISCHEGFFTLMLREYFHFVVGLDKNVESLLKAKQISSLLGHPEIDFQHSTLEDWSEDRCADFVLCFGLLYHVENPIQILRKLSAVTLKTLCIETQVLPYAVTGPIEDGSYLWQRETCGLFGLCVDYSHRPEGGLTDLALVPSRQALEFLLLHLGFKTVTFYKPDIDDYEQFVRGHRVVIFAER